MDLKPPHRNYPLRVAVIGATGSVGGAVLDICRRFPDHFVVTALACHSSIGSLVELAEEFRPNNIALSNSNLLSDLKHSLSYSPILFSGPSALEELTAAGVADHFVFAASGTDAIPALIQALDSSYEISLANKESIVVGGAWVLDHVKYDGQIRPLDSEHSAIWQCLHGEKHKGVRKIWLTASGGPFRDLSLKEMEHVRPSDALRHPIWSMGSKITIDSATLMNKGIELIEAMFLFELSPDQVDAVIHRNSLVHGLVSFCDGSIKALLSAPDMRLPSAAALSYPGRLDLGTSWHLSEPFSWDLAFEAPDPSRFPCLRHAEEAARQGGGAPTVLVGADEVAVEAFLAKKIAFTSIASVVAATLEDLGGQRPCNLEEALDLLDNSRRVAHHHVLRFSRERRRPCC